MSNEIMSRIASALERIADLIEAQKKIGQSIPETDEENNNDYKNWLLEESISSPEDEMNKYVTENQDDDYTFIECRPKSHS